MRRVFITGATGFIGCRAAEMACQRGLEVVALVRTWSRAARLARWPVRLVPGNVLDVESLKTGMAGADVVFHCAVDNRVGGRAHREVSVRGTELVIQAAAATGVRRVVHLSSTAVHGYRPGPDAATESAALRHAGDDYVDGKIDGERAAIREAHRLKVPIVVLRPTIVHGPFGDYSRDTAALIRQGRMVLVDGGRGTCNALYVDNLIEAMFRAAERDGLSGEVFHISDARPVIWREFIEGHGRAIGWSEPLPELSAAELETARRRHRPTSLGQAVALAHDREFRQRLRSIPAVDRSVGALERLAGRALPAVVRPRAKAALFGLRESSGGPAVAASAPAPTASSDPLSRPEELMVTAFSGVTFRIDKARAQLGYQPAVDFREGMRRTAAWLQWARV